MTTRSFLVNMLGLAFIAVCLYFTVGHIGYLNKSGKPSREAIIRELDDVIAAFPGEKSSAVDVFDKQVVYISARVQMKRVNDGLPADYSRKRMEARSWRKVRVAYGDAERYCKGDLVAEVTPLEPSNSYALQVNWGNADAVCSSM